MTNCKHRLFLTFLAFCHLSRLTNGFSFSFASVTHVLEHLISPPSATTRSIALEDLANTRIPGPPGSGVEILAHVSTPSNCEELIKKGSKGPLPVLIMIHEFFGLNRSIVDKAKALSADLGCVVVAPDTFRGTVTGFIPKAIWLALTTPQDRVNDDLDAICSYVESDVLEGGAGRKGDYKLAVMGFCYGGGKAIRYTTQRRNDAATVVFYGSPVTDARDLKRLEHGVCGVYGRDDAQFSMKLLDEFKRALEEAKVDNEIKVYDGVGHAFWTDMEQVRRGDEPQAKAYVQCTTFLRRYFGHT